MNKIYRLSELNPEEKEVVECSILNSEIYKKPNKEFNSFGLRYDINYLNGIGGAIIMFPLEYMADYVDAISKGYIDENNEEFITTQLLDTSDCDMNEWNATSLGNTAYAALNCKNETAQQNSIKLLEKYFDFFFSKFTNNRKYAQFIGLIKKMYPDSK